MLELDTPHGPARGRTCIPPRARRARPRPRRGRRRRRARSRARTEVANGLGITVALVEQPYRVAGRRSTPAAHLLDQAWIPAVEQLRAGPLAGRTLSR